MKTVTAFYPKTSLYRSAEDYLNGPEGMNNEVQMWFVAGGLLLQHLSSKIGNNKFGGLVDRVGSEEQWKLKTLSVLDLCSGAGDFINHLLFSHPKLEGVCFDTNDVFVESGNEKFGRHNIKFIKADAVRLDLQKKFDVVVASSAYHHIPDRNKEKFLGVIRQHLDNRGIAIICDNFLPAYGNTAQRMVAVERYYGSLLEYYKNGNATKGGIKAISEAYALERAGHIEHKVPYSLFLRQIKKTNLKIVADVIVWQPKNLKQDNAGSHVIVLKKA